MDEQVTDISQTLKELANDLKAMRQTVDSQHTEICQLNRTVQAQSKEIKTLKKENTELRTRLSKYEEPPKDSTNKQLSRKQERAERSESTVKVFVTLCFWLWMALIKGIIKPIYDRV